MQVLIASGVLVVAMLAGSAASAQPQDDSFKACIDTLRAERRQHPQVRAETFDRYTLGATDLRPTIASATGSQPEFTIPVWDYVARLVDSERVADGQQALLQHAGPLTAIARRHGVDPATIVAFFGIETDYGRVEGRHGVVDATLSRACLDLKSKERQRHFFAALWLLQQGLVQPETFRGSWAGAFGLTQFMPGTFVAYMDDGDASGSVDIVGSVADALATTAHYVGSLGWTPGLRWGVEVRLPGGALARGLIAAEREHGCLSSQEVAGKCRTVEEWAALGIATNGQAGERLPADAGLPKGTRAALLAPSGPDGPAWLVTRNYRAIWQYNRADAYALAIGLLSDALRGDPPLRRAWPTVDPGLSRAEMRELQQDLFDRGHTDVTPDGADGPRTRAAIRVEELRLGWPETGRAGQQIARALRDERAAAPNAPSGVAPPPAEAPPVTDEAR